ncbi:MAG: bifunctional ligase/repressor BirA [bacterium]|nr:MAG: bifunctional ligase/repressor BirA [bacterium]
MNGDKIFTELETDWLGRELVLLDEVDSTNLHAARLLSEKKLKHGTVIIAKKQTAGRGRFNRSWYSDGGLCLTAALEIDSSLRDAGAVTLTTGTAVGLSLTSLVDWPFEIKYPNDIMAGGRKLGGIIAEVKKPFVILGIGINVEQKFFPAEISEKAVSLAQLGMDVDRETVAVSIINMLEPMIDIFSEKGFGELRPYWIKMNCTLGKNVVIEKVKGQTRGKAIDLDDDGVLLVETKSGMERVNTGDVLLEQSG